MLVRDCVGVSVNCEVCGRHNYSNRRDDTPPPVVDLLIRVSSSPTHDDDRLAHLTIYYYHRVFKSHENEYETLRHIVPVTQGWAQWYTKAHFLSSKI